MKFTITYSNHAGHATAEVVEADAFQLSGPDSVVFVSKALGGPSHFFANVIRVVVEAPSGIVGVSSLVRGL